MSLKNWTWETSWKKKSNVKQAGRLPFLLYHLSEVDISRCSFHLCDHESRASSQSKAGLGMVGPNLAATFFCLFSPLWCELKHLIAPRKMLKVCLDFPFFGLSYLTVLTSMLCDLWIVVAQSTIWQAWGQSIWNRWKQHRHTNPSPKSFQLSVSESRLPMNMFGLFGAHPYMAVPTGYPGLEHFGASGNAPSATHVCFRCLSI